MSVVVPARNAAATIDDQLEALARQDYGGDWELIVVDNGSTDDTGVRARSWTQRVPSIRVVDVPYRPGASVSSSRNAGVAASSGDFVAFCDADDVVVDGWLSALVRAAAHADLAGGPVEIEALNDPVVRSWVRWDPPRDDLAPALRFLPGIFGGACGVWRAAFDDVGGWNERYTGHEDTELSWRLQLAGYRVAFAPGAVVHYRLRTPLRVLVKKEYRDGQVQVRLFGDFRARGMPRTDTRRALRTWAGRVRRLPDLVRAESRGNYLRVTAALAGRLVGSIRARTLYL